MMDVFKESLNKSKDYHNFDLSYIYICCWLSYLSYKTPKQQSNYLKKYNFLDIQFVKNQNAHATLLCYNNDLYVVIRGTDFSNEKDLRNDFDITWSKESYGTVHSGYKKHLDLIWDEIISYIKKYQDRKVIFTGHSMGGACGQIANCRLENTIGYYFGSPRCIDRNTKNKNKNAVFNLQHEYDIVPELPPKTFGFELLGDIFIISKNNIINQQIKWCDTFYSIFYTLVYFILKIFGDRKRFVNLILVNHKIYDYLTNIKRLTKN